MSKDDYHIRLSKTVFVHGPGSLLNFHDNNSAIMLTPDYWTSRETVHEPRLAKRMGVGHFVCPPSNPKAKRFQKGIRQEGIRGLVFPYLKQCVGCGLLQPSEACRSCRSRTIPPRIVAVCLKGHIEDFPWKSWSQCTCPPGEEALHIESMQSIEDSDLKVTCRVCKKGKSFSGTLDTLDVRCSGATPWLSNDYVTDDPDDPCPYYLRGIMRGASNVYFPIIKSSLSIPPYSSDLHKRIRPLIEHFRPNYKAGTLDSMIMIHAETSMMIKEGLYTLEQISGAFQAEYGELPGGQIKESDIRPEEYAMLTGPDSLGLNDDFQTHDLPLHDPLLRRWFRSVKRVTRLREVAAIEGFTRLKPYEWNKIDRFRVQRINKYHWPLQRVGGERPRSDIDYIYLPGVELYGEGIFFEFNEERVMEWLWDGDNTEITASIVGAKTGTSLNDDVGINDEKMPLLHTFSHLMIRQLALSCGYPVASIKERLYIGNNMCGVLLYTTTSDNFGTMGGLVSQADNEVTLMDHIISMLRGASVCSQDPFCSDHRPKTTGNPWGASCHSCTHLPETSCEGLNNKLLDRRLVVGAENDSGSIIGYFDDKEYHSDDQWTISESLPAIDSESVESHQASMELEAVLSHMSDDDAEVRVKAVELAGFMDEPAALPHLKNALQDVSKKVRLKARFALSLMGSRLDNKGG